MKRVYWIVPVLVAFAISLEVGASRVEATGNTPVKKTRLYEKLLQDSSVFTMRLEKSTVYFPGKTFTANIHVKHAKGWHLYSSLMSPDAGPRPLSVTLPDDLVNTYSIVALKESGKLTARFDSNFSAETKAYYGDFDLHVTVRVNKSAPLGKTPFGLVVSYMTCSESICLPSRNYAVPMVFLGQKPIELSLVATPKDSAKAMLNDTTSGLQATVPTSGSPSASSPTEPPKGAAINAAPPSATSTQPIDGQDLNDISIWRYILLAAGFGLTALLTPCVYPMVPITISFFTKRNAGSRKATVMDASLYAVGIILTFVVIGFLLALLFGKHAINSFAANPFANLFIAGVFVAFALNLFGLFEIGVPSSILTKLNSAATNSKNKYLSVMIMGFVFSLASFTCTVPFVGQLMVTFSNGTVARPLIGMTVYATVFASPFFLLALFPSLLKSMPRSGGWMNSVKVVMGFLELAAAMKFFSNVDLVWHWGFFTRDLVLASWIAVVILTTFYLLGRFRMSHDTPIEHIGAVRALIAVFFLSIGVYLYTGLNGRPLGKLDAFLPPVDVGVTAASMGAGVSGQPAIQQERWFANYTDALAESKKTGKNIFIDFTGYTCTNCRAMESTVFSKADVQLLFKDFVLARLYTDDGSPLNDSNRTLEETRFNTIALPFYAIVTPKDKPLQTFPGYTPDREAFKRFLSQNSKASLSVAMAGE